MTQRCDAAMVMPRAPWQHGYTYFGVLFAVALIGLSLVGASFLMRVERQREKEQQLLFVGQQYMNAIASYYNQSPGGDRRYPATLAALLRDPRFPTINRHLRKPWPDPMTVSGEWGLVRARGGGIAGVYSLSRDKPLKRKGFADAMLERLLADKNSYRDWKFVYVVESDDAVDIKELQPADSRGTISSSPSLTQ